MSRTVRACLVAAVLIPVSAFADLITVVASDSGFVTGSGSTDKFDGLISPATGNYSVGYEVACPYGGLCSPPFIPMQHKNYFVFDLSSVTGTIVAASLELFNPIGGYESADVTETYVVGGTSPGAVPGILGMLSAIAGVGVPGEVDDGCGNPAPPPDDPLVCTAAGMYPMLADSLGPVGPGPVDLLAPGVTPIALATLTSLSDGTVVSVVFTPIGLSYLNLFTGSTLLLGGALSSSVPPGLPQSVFGFSSDDTVPPPTLKLTTVVPLPMTLPLLSSALFLLGMARREEIFSWRLTA